MIEPAQISDDDIIEDILESCYLWLKQLVHASILIVGVVSFCV